MPSPIPPILGVLVEFFPLLTGCYWKAFFPLFLLPFPYILFTPSGIPTVYWYLFFFSPGILDQMHLLGQKQILINCILGHLLRLT